MSERRHYSQERVQLAECYPGKKWVKKVMEMSDAQVHATLVSIRKKREKSTAENDSQKLPFLA